MAPLSGTGGTRRDKSESVPIQASPEWRESGTGRDTHPIGVSRLSQRPEGPKFCAPAGHADRRRPGRPSKGSNVMKAAIFARVTGTEKEEITSEAEAEGQALGPFLRDLVMLARRVRREARGEN